MLIRTLALACALAMPAAADVLEEWTGIALARSAAAHHPPFFQTRTMAMLEIAMFEAINGSEGPYQPFLSRAASPAVAVAGLGAAGTADSRSAAAAVAAHDVLASIFPEEKAALDADLDRALAPGGADANAA